MAVAYLMTYGTRALDVQPADERAEEEEEEEEEVGEEADLATAAVALPASSSSLSLATLPSSTTATSSSPAALSRAPSGSSTLSAQQASAAASSAPSGSPLAMSYDHALAFVQSHRPAICPNDGFRAQLRQYEDRLRRRGTAGGRESGAAATISSERA